MAHRIGGILRGEDLILKGRTSLRKCRLGNAGRFSTDLNFIAPDEFERRPAILPPEQLGYIPIAVHRSYELQLQALSGIAESEACAEKLARYQRTALARDVYDLAQFAGRAIDETLVRRLWVLKVWGDIVDDGRGEKPLDPADVLREKKEKDFASESIGALTQPSDIAGWERRARWQGPTRPGRGASLRTDLASHGVAPPSTERETVGWESTTRTERAVAALLGEA